jgi:hypothetical protein
MEQSWRVLTLVAEETPLKKQLLVLFAFTSLAILIATLAVVRGYASLEAVSLTLMATFALAAGLFTVVEQEAKRISCLKNGEPEVCIPLALGTVCRECCSCPDSIRA